MTKKKTIQEVYARSKKDWRKWLEKNHATETAVWLLMYKKDSGIPSVTYNEAVDEALCFGWIDSKMNKRDEQSFVQYFALRNPKSNWSRINKNKVEQLIAECRMADAGLKMVQLAKQTGTWNALDDVENLVVPPDMMQLFNLNKEAYVYWQAFPRSAKRGILEWIQNAKRAETRAKRIHQAVDKAAENKRVLFDQ